MTLTAFLAKQRCNRASWGSSIILGPKQRPGQVTPRLHGAWELPALDGGGGGEEEGRAGASAWGGERKAEASQKGIGLAAGPRLCPSKWGKGGRGERKIIILINPNASRLSFPAGGKKGWVGGEKGGQREGISGNSLPSHPPPHYKKRLLLFPPPPTPSKAISTLGGAIVILDRARAHALNQGPALPRCGRGGGGRQATSGGREGLLRQFLARLSSLGKPRRNDNGGGGGNGRRERRSSALHPPPAFPAPVGARRAPFALVGSDRRRLHPPLLFVRCAGPGPWRRWRQPAEAREVAGKAAAAARAKA